MIGIGLGDRQPTSDQFVGGALHGLTGGAKPARRLRDRQRRVGEDAEGVPPRLRLAFPLCDLVGDPTK